MSESIDTPQPAPKSRYSMGSAPNMLRSLLAIGAIMAVLIFMVPRVNSISAPTVDVHKTGLDVASRSGWPILEARGLPKGWNATSARYVRTSDGAMTWLAGYQAPSGNYVSVEQTKAADSAWIEAETNRAARTGKVEVAGKTWTTFVRDNKVQNSMLHNPENSAELTTLVTGTATFEEMRVFTEHLTPVK